MTVLKHAAPTRPHTRLVGYVNRRTEEICCLEHGRHDIESPRSPWAPLRLTNRPEARYESTTPLICHECGTWLNDGSTGYAVTSPHDGYWKRRLRRARGHRDG
jgi:hypothetical protein